MTALLPLGLPAAGWADAGAPDGLDNWRELYRQLGDAVEAAQIAVQLASDAYRRQRSPRTEDAYRAADRAYDTARARFQTEGAAIVRRIKDEARKQQEARFADAMKERMI